MTCVRTPVVFADLHGDDPAAAEAARRHLDACARCRLEVADLESVWEELGELPEEEPDSEAEQRFRRLLDTVRETAATLPPDPGSAGTGGAGGWRWAAVVLTALGAGLLGLLAGRGLEPASRAPEVEMLRAELRETNRLVTDVLLEHREATDRLQAVAMAARQGPGTPATAALVEAARNDPSVNVRLAAIEALASWVDRPEVVRSLGRSLGTETAPLAQVALIEALSRATGPEARSSLRAARSRELRPEVRALLEEALSREI